MTSASTYIQCPECGQFMACNTYNAATCNYRCTICGPISKKRVEEPGSNLFCHEINYGPKGTDIPFDKKVVRKFIEQKTL